jgi:hypothetical protein
MSLGVENGDFSLGWWSREMWVVSNDGASRVWLSENLAEQWQRKEESRCEHCA